MCCHFWIIVILYNSGRADQSLPSTGEAMSNSSPERNKAIVLEAFETLFNKRDYVAAERFWSADFVRFEDGLLKEHWDVLQDEATKAESVSGLPMFGDVFPK
jgi:hypothetical protein